MTTILADSRLGVMVADSSVTDGDRIWHGDRKVFRVHNQLLGFAGDYEEGILFVEWFKSGCPPMAKPKLRETDTLVLAAHGLYLYPYASLDPRRIVSGVQAIGSGGKAAMCAYEAMGYSNPRRAVQIVCKHDAESRSPARVYKIKS